MSARSHALAAILPCNDLDASEAFYARLGFARRSGDDSYRILADEDGAALHLRKAEPGWLAPGRNPFGLYLSTAKVAALAAGAKDLLLGPPEAKPWGMYEFAVSDPDQTLVRVGWPTRLIDPLTMGT
jgi:predicted lactoylglutathione lyase